MKYIYLFFVATVTSMGVALLASPVAAKRNAIPSSAISYAHALQIAKCYVSVHKDWAKEAVYDLKRDGNDWLVNVRPQNFKGLDGLEFLIVIDRHGKVLHYFQSD